MRDQRKPKGDEMTKQQRLTGPQIARRAMAERTGEKELEALIADIRERNWHSLDAMEIVIRAFYKESRAWWAQEASEAKAKAATTKAGKGVE